MATQRDQQFIGEARRAAIAIWTGIRILKGMQAEWNALDYGTTLEDGVGEHDGITRAELGAAIFATADALEATLAGGHATNLAKLL